MTTLTASGQLFTKTIFSDQCSRFRPGINTVWNRTKPTLWRLLHLKPCLIACYLPGKFLLGVRHDSNSVLAKALHHDIIHRSGHHLKSDTRQFEQVGTSVLIRTTWYCHKRQNACLLSLRSSAFRDADITGHDYLKNVIHLPFFLRETTRKLKRLGWGDCC